MSLYTSSTAIEKQGKNILKNENEYDDDNDDVDDDDEEFVYFHDYKHVHQCSRHMYDK